MPKKIKNAPPASSPWDSEVRLLAWLATCVSVFSFLFYFQRGDVLLYGDAVAHINIARRVFDSKTPGPAATRHSVASSAASADDSVPALERNVAARRGRIHPFDGGVCVRRGRNISPGSRRSANAAEPDAPARIAAWTAALIFAANPNLIYMQSTAMGEALYLALFIWAVVYFRPNSVRGRREGADEVRPLSRCGVPHAL